MQSDGVAFVVVVGSSSGGGGGVSYAGRMMMRYREICGGDGWRWPAAVAVGRAKRILKCDVIWPMKVGF